MRFAGRHLLAGAAGMAFIYFFWLTRPQWDPEMRLWKAVGDASLLMLYVTVSVGPMARLWPLAARLIPHRREVGIWFGLLALVHTFLILDGWAQWSVSRFLGYEFIPQLGRTARMEPGFGLANILGLLAVLMTIPLIATSTDWATRKLGGSAWKFLHNATYVIFWLVVLHTAYFLFLHYTVSFHRVPPPPDWARLPFAGLTLVVVSLQSLAFIATVRRRSAAGVPRSRRAVADVEGMDQAAAVRLTSATPPRAKAIDASLNRDAPGEHVSPPTARSPKPGTGRRRR